MWIYFTFALFSSWKFMFTPMAGPLSGLTFTETLLSCLAGAYASATFFYWGANYLMHLKQTYLNANPHKLKENSKRWKRKQQVNRRIVKLKQRFHPLLVCWLFPLFLSLPIGTIVTAKFYRHRPFTYWFVMLGVTLNGFLLTTIAYSINDLTLK